MIRAGIPTCGAARPQPLLVIMTRNIWQMIRVRFDDIVSWTVDGKLTRSASPKRMGSSEGTNFTAFMPQIFSATRYLAADVARLSDLFDPYRQQNRPNAAYTAQCQDSPETVPARHQ